MLIFDLRKRPENRRVEYVSGKCAKCGEAVYEAMVTLDDAYNVWAGKCPYCQAINLLSVNHGLRGYSSAGMHLVLPFDEEIAANPELPDDTPSAGPNGQPATMHGSPLGELCHKLTEGDEFA